MLSLLLFTLHFTSLASTAWGYQATLCFARTTGRASVRRYVQRSSDASTHHRLNPLDGGQSSPRSSTDTDASSVTGVTLKLALDTSGGVACRSEIKPKRFTSPESLDMVHRLRAASDAVLVGVGTVLADNPSLLVKRNIPCIRQPLRVVVDPSLKLILKSENSCQDYQLLSDGHQVVIYHCQEIVSDKVNGESLPKMSSSVQLIYLEPRRVPLSSPGKHIAADDIVDDLRTRFEVRHLMVEGGPITAQAFLHARIIDRCLLVNAPVAFAEPILSGISSEQLSETLSFVGSVSSGVDTVECWSRPHVPWPTEQLRDWP